MIIGTKANELPILTGLIPDAQLVIVPDPITGTLKRATFGQVKATITLPNLDYLDQIIEVDTVAALPVTGEIKKIYVITTGADANKQFRWGGSMYIEFPAGSGDVAGEAVIRGNADAALQAGIDDVGVSLADTQTTLQGNIDAEAINRSNADIILNTKVATEANTRLNNDSTLQALINTEGATRATADTTLQNNINSEATTRDGADTYLSNRIDLKLNTADYNEHFLGKYTTLTALQAAHPTAAAGDYAQVDAGAASVVVNYNYDVEDGWVIGAGGGSGATTTDELPEGATNKYFTNGRAIAAVDISGKVDKVSGKQLSTEDYSTTEKSKLLGIASGAQVNDANTTLQGNTFNGVSQLIKTTAASKYPALDGSLITNLPSGTAGIYAGTGTAFTSYTVGDLIYASAINILSKLAAGTNGQVLTLAAGVPAWAAAASSPWTVSGSDIYYATGKVSIGTVTPSVGLLTVKAASLATPGIILSTTPSVGTAKPSAALILEASNYDTTLAQNSPHQWRLFNSSLAASTGNLVTTRLSFQQDNGNGSWADEVSFSRGIIYCTGIFFTAAGNIGETASSLYNDYIFYNTRDATVNGTVRGITLSGMAAQLGGARYAMYSPSFTQIASAINFSNVTEYAYFKTEGRVFSGTTPIKSCWALSIALPTYRDIIIANATGEVGIGGSPNLSAKLDVQSTTQGVLLPRMTTTQRDAISSPAEGLIIYNTTTHKLNLFTTAWEQVTSA